MALRSGFAERCGWPGRTTFVARYDRIFATWTDIKGRDRSRVLNAMNARVFQHETDHLNGRCIFP